MPNRKVTISERKKRLVESKRAAKGYTQIKMAKKIGLKSAPAYCYIESHINEYFKLDVLRSICKTLDIDVAELVKED